MNDKEFSIGLRYSDEWLDYNYTVLEVQSLRVELLLLLLLLLLCQNRLIID